MVEYKPVVSFPGYLVGSDGSVIGKFGITLKPGRRKRGYLFVTLSRGKRPNIEKVTIGIHRIVCEAFHGSPHCDGLHARHLDGVPDNNCSTNLAWGTPKENYADRIRHGTYSAGDLNPSAKLDSKKVEEIRNLLLQKVRPSRIARDYGVGKSIIYNIRNGVNWNFNHSSGVHEDTKLDVCIRPFHGRKRRQMGPVYV